MFVSCKEIMRRCSFDADAIPTQCPGSAAMGAVTSCGPLHTIAKTTTIRGTTYDSDSSRSSAETGSIHNDDDAGVAEDHTDEDGCKKMRAEHIRRRNRVILFLLLASIIIFVIVDSLTSKHIPKVFSSLYHWVDLYPLPGAFVLTLVTFVATLAFIPGSVLTVGCGVVFGMTLDLGAGVAVGSVVVFFGASLGSIASFIMGRYLLRDCVGNWVARSPVFKAVEQAMKKRGFRILFLLRLSPIIPFNALNYMAGMTAVTFRSYTLALIGILPGTILFVFVGASAGSSMDMGGNHVKNNTRIASIVAGVILGALGIIAASYYAKKELNNIIAEQEVEQQDQGNVEQQVSTDCDDEGSSSSPGENRVVTFGYDYEHSVGGVCDNGGSTTLAAGDQSDDSVDLHQDIDKEFLDILYAPGRGNESVVSDGSHPVYDDIDDEFFDILYAPAGKPDEAIETPDNEAAVVCDGVSTSAKITKTNPLAENVTRTTK